MGTKFHVDQPIAAPPDAVQAAFLDPDFYPTLGEMPAISPPELLECVEQDGRVRLRVRYAFSGDLAPPARAVLDPNRLTWIDESVVDVEARCTTFRISPDHYGDRFSCDGRYELVPDGDGTLQRLDGEVRVRWPLVGRLAERGIVRGLEEHIRTEAALIERYANR
jgi:hypothetical protein